MTTKPGISIQPLDLDDLDQVVGGRAAMGGALPASDSHGADSAFMASLHGVAAVASGGTPPGNDRPELDAAHHHEAAAAAHELVTPHDHASPGSPSVHAEHRASATPGSGEVAGADAVRPLLGPEATHDLHAACERVAATGMPLTLFHPEHDLVQVGVGSPSMSGWDDDFARHLAAGDHGPVPSSASTPMSDEAIRWETSVLRDSPAAQETLEATAPHFLAESHSLFEDRRQKIAALFATRQPIAAP